MAVVYIFDQCVPARKNVLHKLPLCVVVIALSVIMGLSSATADPSSFVNEIVCADKDKQPYCVPNGTLKISTVANQTVTKVNFDPNTITCVLVKADTQSYTCTITSTTAVPNNQYAMTVSFSSDKSEKYYILFGQYYGAAVKLWSTAAPDSSLFTSDYTSTLIASGSPLRIYGKFDDKLNYTVTFYKSEQDPGATPATTSSMPTCGKIIAKSNYVECTVVSEAGVMGMFSALVASSGSSQSTYIPGTFDLPLIGIYPPLPVIKSVQGPCVTDSASCANKTSLTFSGTNFNTRQPKYNNIKIGSDASTKTASFITCIPESVTAESLTCSLTIPGENTYSGLYPIYIRVQICFMGMLAPKVLAGMLSIGAGKGKPGWIRAVDSYYVTDISPASIQSGETLAVFGSFNSTATYSVSFITDAATATAAYACEDVHVTATKITCKTHFTGVSSQATGSVLVTNTAEEVSLITNSTVPTVALLLTGHVSSASGKCASDSSECKTGSVIVFWGSNFDVTKKTNNRIVANSTKVLLTSIAVNSSALTCSITVNSKDAAVYALSMQLMKPDNTWSDPAVPVGFLAINAGQNAPGWLPNNTTSLIISEYTDNSMNKRAIAAIVILSILVAALIVILCTTCYKFQTTTQKNIADDEAFRSVLDNARNYSNLHDSSNDRANYQSKQETV